MKYCRLLIDTLKVKLQREISTALSDVRNLNNETPREPHQPEEDIKSQDCHRRLERNMEKLESLQKHDEVSNAYFHSLEGCFVPFFQAESIGISHSCHWIALYSV